MFVETPLIGFLELVSFGWKGLVGQLVGLIDYSINFHLTSCESKSSNFHVNSMAMFLPFLTLWCRTKNHHQSDITRRRRCRREHTLAIMDSNITNQLLISHQSSVFWSSGNWKNRWFEFLKDMLTYREVYFDQVSRRHISFTQSPNWRTKRFHLYLYSN